jgi:aspartyl-tRNA(Asn)/glutamyl-tRNA(Gln) amidotransferase subunit A
MGPIAIGTDSAGSIRVPAAYTGIFGIKPTMGRIPAVQRWRASPARSHNGPLTRTVQDSALLLAALSGSDARDPASRLEPIGSWDPAPHHLRGRVVGIVATEGAPSGIVEEAGSLLRTLGAETVQAPSPPSTSAPRELEPGVWAYSGDHYAAAETLTPDFWAKHGDDLTEYARPIYEAGRRALAWQYRQVLRLDQQFAHELRIWFQPYDYLVTAIGPGAPTNASFTDVAGLGRTFPMLSRFNISGNPAAAVPMGVDDHGLPVAVQVVGRFGDDAGVLAVCAAMEAARPWAHRWPDVAAPAGG